MRCTACNCENPPKARFCVECGTVLGNLCPRCGAENLQQFKFCAECGASLRDSSQPPSLVRPATTSPSQSFGAEYSRQPEEALESERKTITALFADIKSSMELIENLDPEEAQSIIDPALRVMMKATRRYGGQSCSPPAVAFSLRLAPPWRTRSIRNEPPCGAYNARRAQPLLRRIARPGPQTGAGTSRGKYWRGGGALVSDGRGACR